MNKSLKNKPPFADRSPVHGFIALCVLTVIDGWPILLCLALALAMSGQAKAADVPADPDYVQACQEEVAEANTLEIELRPIVVSESIRRVTVAELTNERWGATHRVNNVVLGHTVAPWSLQTEVGVTGVEHRSGKAFCYKPAVKIVLGYKPIEISVASEIKGQCELDYIVEHENEHVRLYVENLPVVAAAVRAELEPMLKMAHAETEEAAQKLVYADMADKLGPMVQRQVDILAAKHAEFDKHDVQKMMASPCFAQMQSVGQVARNRFR